MTGAERLIRVDRATPALRQVRSPAGMRRIAWIIGVSFGLLAVALAVLPWQQSARAAGRVVAFSPSERPQSIEAPVEGRIVKWYVREGSRVEAGDALLELADNDASILERLQEERRAVEARLEAAKARANAIESRKGSLEVSRGDALAAAESRHRMAIERIKGAEQSLQASSAAHRTAKLNYERQATLLDQGLASRRAYEQAELEEARTSAELERARTALTAAQQEAEAIARDRSKVGNDARAGIEDARAAQASATAEIAAAYAELARIDVRLARQNAQFVNAPRKGTIRRVIAPEGGEMLKVGDPVALLVPDTAERAVELWIDGNEAPLVREGRSVRLQFEGWPALQLSGWPNVAAGTFGGRVAVVDDADDGKGKFRVLVVPEAEEPWPEAFLRQGTRAHGWILLEVVPLGWEAWRIFNGFPPDLPPDVPIEGKAKK